MLRAVLRRAHPDTEWSGKISGLQFNSAPEVQEIATAPRSNRGEVHLEANGEPRPDPSEREEDMGGINKRRARI